jgi:arylsulfatase A-like enzyme
MSNHHSQTSPNIIWIFGDQHRAQALGCNGDSNLNTPNIDIMSELGVNFTAAVSGFPLCCPFRGSLLTGVYPHKCVPGHEYRMPPEQSTIANVFNDAGYKTAYFGKWHVDGFKETEGRAAMHIIPPERRGGFQSWVGYENNNSQWDSWVHGGEGSNAFHYRLPGYETDELTNLLLNYINDRANDRKAGNEAPFFAVLSVQPPHDPYVAPEEYMRRHNSAQIKLRPNVPDVPWVVERARRELAGYYAMIENLDWNIGKIRKTLEETGLAQETYLIFFSDHGDMHGSHGQFKKTIPYEEAIRVPFIISGGESCYYTYYNGKKMGRFPVLINHVDIAPTTLGLCNIDKPDWMEGTDYSSYKLESRKAVNLPDSAYIQSVAPNGHSDSIDKPWRGVVTNDGWKYVCFEGIPWLMFNLDDDPFEQANLAHNSRFSAQRKRLNDRLAAWIEKTGDRFRLPVL